VEERGRDGVAGASRLHRLPGCGVLYHIVGARGELQPLRPLIPAGCPAHGKGQCGGKRRQRRGSADPTDQLPLLKSGSRARGRGVWCAVQMCVSRPGVPKGGAIGGVRHPHRWAARNTLFMAPNSYFRTLGKSQRHVAICSPGCQCRGCASAAPPTGQLDRLGTQGTRQVYRRGLTCAQSSRDLVSQRRAFHSLKVFTASLTQESPSRRDGL